MSLIFPLYATELERLDALDQADVTGHYRRLRSVGNSRRKIDLGYELARRCHDRAAQMLAMLDVIKMPTVANIGMQGSLAVSLLALHSYKDIMKTVLAVYQKCYDHDPASIYKPAIAQLADRIMILEMRQQRYATNWMATAANQFFLIPVVDFENVNGRRATYGLGPAHKPVVRVSGKKTFPLGEGDAVSKDQKQLTNAEFEEYSRYYLHKIV